MTDFYLIRHAQAEGNLYRRPQGQYDANITMLGRRQVAALAERFRDVPIDALYTSDLVRAQSTASAILKYHPALSLHTDRALREVAMGCWEDRTWSELARDWPEAHRLFGSDPGRWHVEGSERYEDVQQRMARALLGLAEAWPGKTVAVVSHAFAIRALACFLKGVPFDQLPYSGNTAVTRVRAEDGTLVLVNYGDTSHLDALRSAGQSLALGQRTDALFFPLALPAEKDYYIHSYSQTWLASHGDLAGFVPALYLRSAARRAKSDPQCLVKLTYGGETAGLIELDPDRDAGKGAGWISLIWVEPSWRGRRLGTQLVGHAVSYFRHKGREKLHLHVSQTNDAALAFYESLGFSKQGVAEGVGGPLYLLEMDIAPRVWRLP